MADLECPDPEAGIGEGLDPTKDWVEWNIAWKRVRCLNILLEMIEDGLAEQAEDLRGWFWVHFVQKKD